MRFLLPGCLTVLLATSIAWAQPPGPPPGLPPANGDFLELNPPAEEPDDDDSLRPEGDTVVLANGKELAGVRVLRETARGVEVEVLQGSPPLLIPRRQVEKIIYDKSGASRARAGEENDGDGRPDMLSAAELSPALHEKLTSVLNEEPMEIQDRDFIVVLEEVLGNAAVPLDIDPLVREIPPVRRLWARTIPAGTNAFTLLKEYLATDFPMVDVVNEFDRVVIRMKREEGDGF